MRNNESNKKLKFNNLDEIQKVNYIKNLLFNHDLTYALDILLKDEKKDLRIIKTIVKVLEEDLIINRIKQECNIKCNAMIYVYSKIIGVLAFYNKQNILEVFFKSLDSNTLKEIAYYEYQNRTLVSISSEVFKKYCSKYRQEAKKSLAMSNEEVLMLTTGMERYNFIYKKKSRNFKWIKYISIAFVFIMCLFLGFKIYSTNKDISKYDGLVFQGIYLGDVNLSKLNINELEAILLAEKEKIENGTIMIANVNGNYNYTYKELGIKVEYESTLEDIKKYNKDLSWFKKVSMIDSDKRYKTFYLESNFSDDAIDKFLLSLENKLNTEPITDKLKVDNNYNVYYDKGKNGFKLDVTKTKESLKMALSNLTEESVIEAYGDVVKNETKNKALSVVDKKISTYTTYFSNTGNRGHNIVLASSRLNGTLLMPGDVFSYLKAVGPYSYANGYRPAPAYVNGVVSTANGGGVCQLTSTLYNAQLKAGLETVYRTYHIFAPDYVPKGLDATVYSTTVDYKFKNQYNYPIYIVSYVNGNNLTVDIWSSKDALGNKSYEAYSVYSNGGYNSYLKEYENGILINEKYLGRSVYKSH